MYSAASLFVLAIVLEEVEAARSSMRNVSLHSTGLALQSGTSTMANTFFVQASLDDTTTIIEHEITVQQNGISTTASDSFVERSSNQTASLKQHESVLSYIASDKISIAEEVYHLIDLVLGISGLLIAFSCAAFGVVFCVRSEKDSCPRIAHIHENEILYEWDQTSTVVNIYMKTLPNADSDDLEIEISPKKLKIGRRGKPAILQKDFYAPIIVEESNWNICRNGELKIALSKAKDGEWRKALLH